MESRRCKLCPDDQLLTQAEVDALDEGVLVCVQWSGGDGPWVYKIKRQKGAVFAVSPQNQRADISQWGSALEFVGKQRWRDKVCLLEA